MKKSIFTYASLILSAATLLSCQKLEEVNDSLVAAGTHSVVVTTDATRTVNDGMHTYFENGDKMTVIYNRDGSSNYHANEYTFSSSTGEFSGDGDIRSQYNYNWFGVYPSNSAITTAKSVSVSIPASQNQVGNDSKAALAGTGFPLAGKTNAPVKGGVTPSFNVSNVATVLDFHITNGSDTPLTVTKVEFTAPDGIAGSFTADLTASNISWTAATSASKTVTLNVASGAALEKGASADFYAGAGPFSGPGSYTIKVTAKDAEGQTFVSSKTINGSLDCKSSTIHTISHTFVPGEPVTGVTGYELVTSEPSDWSGRYILVSADKKLVFTGDNGTNNKYTLSSTDLSDGIITKDCSAYEFTITKSGSNYYLKNTAKNQYLYCDYSGNGNTGMSYSSSQRALNLKVQNDGTFGFWMREGSTDQYIYYKSSSGYFKFGGSHDNHCVYLYKWTEGGTPDVPPTPSTDKTYKKVTSFESGKNYVIVYDGHALQNNSGSPAAYSVTASGNTLTLPAEDASSLEWTATSVSDWTVSGHFSLSNNGKYAARTDDRNNGFEFQTTTVQKAVWDLDADGNDLYHKNSNGQYTFYLTYSSNKWSVSSQNSSNKIAVYAEDGSQPEKQTQTLSFASSSVEWTLGDTYKVDGTYDAQAVTGAETTVTFKSSDTSVATISDGKIKIVGEGTTTITATAAEDDTWYGASASYTLKINPAPVQPSVSGYELVTSEPSDWSGSYLIVDVNKAKVFTGKTDQSNYYTLKSSDIEGNVITNSSLSQYAFTITKNGNNFYLKQGNNNYSVNWTSNSSTGIVTSTSQTAISYGGVLSNGAFLFYGVDSNVNKYLYVKSGEAYFKFGESGGKTGILLYKYTDGSTPDVPPTPPTPGEEITYTKVNSLSEGTYLICGYESDSGKKGTYVCLFPTENTASSSIKSSNRCAEFKFSDDNNITEITTDDASIIGSEVKITKSGNNWLVQYNGQYMYYNNGAIAFTSTASSAAQSIDLSSSTGRGAMKHGSQEFYHSGTDKAFGYTQNKGASNLMFFKKEGSSIPSEPTADGTVFNLENSSVNNFLTAAASSYTDGNWSTTSVVTNYCKSGWGNSYTADNREDIPAPVTITWSNQASGTKTLTVYNDSNRADIETSVTTTSTSAEIYNLIPGRTYYYTVSTTGNSNIASGYFKTEGRRRMMLVGKKSDFGQDYANNCRDFGGLTTTNGKTVKYNKIFRGSNMDRTSSDQKTYLKGYMSIDLDVDLRGNSGNPLGVTLSNQYYNSWNDLSNSTKMKATLNDIFTAVKNNKTIYIHCLVGADRTGYVCMLLQALLGVSEKDCSIDYELTSFSTIGVRARSGQGNVYFTQGMNHIEGQSGSTFQQKAVNYVKSLGFTDSDIETFQNNMLQ